MTTSSLLFIGGLGTPELMRGMGVGIKNFKEGVNGINEEIKKDVNKAEEADKKEDK